MKLRYLIVALLVLSLCSTTVFAKDYFADKTYARMNLSIRSTLYVEPQSSEYTIHYIIAKFYFYPEDTYMQDVSDLEIIPMGKVKEDHLLYEWEDAIAEDIVFGYDADIYISDTYPRITRKISFPVRVELTEETVQYLKSTQNIDSDEQSVIELASILAEGEDDMYRVVTKLASWTKENIEYNLSTSTATVSQSASWTLKNRKGVCDELTSLFVAMSRSLGIPARFVAGISHTNSPLFVQEWGPHGWAEVYFPGYGWVPFDPTYGQYGFVDPSHIRLKLSDDPDDASTRFEWKSRNVDIKPASNIEVSVDVYEIGSSHPSVLSLRMILLNNEVGFGSYQLAEVNIQNLADYYVATSLTLFTSREVEIVGAHESPVILGPGESQIVSFILKVSDDLDETMMYTFPLTVVTSMNQSITSEFIAHVDHSLAKLSDIQKIIEQRDEEQSKKYSTDVLFECRAVEKELYIGDIGKVNCSLRNLGNTILYNVSMCFEQDCRYHTLGINQVFQEDYIISKDETGIFPYTFIARNSEFSKLSVLDIEIKDVPRLSVQNVSVPETIGYDEDFQLKFILSKDSKSNPRLVSIDLNVNGVKNRWTIDVMRMDQDFAIDINSMSLSYGVNEITIYVEYFDDAGRRHSSEGRASIDLVDASPVQKIILLVISISKKIMMSFGGLFS